MLALPRVSVSQGNGLFVAGCSITTAKAPASGLLCATGSLDLPLIANTLGGHTGDEHAERTGTGYRGSLVQG